MPPERFPPDDPREWLNRARSNLLTLVEQTAVQIPDPVRRAEDLTRYAVVTRYPGLVEPVSESHYRDALVSAEAVVRWAEIEIG